MSLHPTIMRCMLEEKYSELVVSGDLVADPHCTDQYELGTRIFKECDDIINLSGDASSCYHECEAFAKCICTMPSYTNSIMIRYHVKQLYIRLLTEGYDPENINFEGVFAKKALEYKPIVERLADTPDDPKYKTRRIEQFVHEFISKVDSGKIAVPVTRPYLNYIPTALAKGILIKYTSEHI